MRSQGERERERKRERERGGETRRQFARDVKEEDFYSRYHFRAPPTKLLRSCACASLSAKTPKAAKATKATEATKRIVQWQMLGVKGEKERAFFLIREAEWAKLTSVCGNCMLPFLPC